jgi:hypothetical protein
MVVVIAPGHRNSGCWPATVLALRNFYVGVIKSHWRYLVKAQIQVADG